MVKIMVAMVLFMLSKLVFGTEQVIDLQLKNLSLKQYQYSPAIAEDKRISFEHEGITESYFFYRPENWRQQMPVLIALHGAGRSGASMIDAWKNSAEKYGFIVIAPNGRGNRWDPARDDSAFIHAAIPHALNNLQIQISQIYLFGHSSGALKALALAATHPAEFTSVVAHAGTLPQISNHPLLSADIPKPKVGIYLGDSDHIFSVESARTTISWFSNSGFSTSLFVLKNHSHWYYEDFDRINESAWNFMSR